MATLLDIPCTWNRVYSSAAVALIFSHPVQRNDFLHTMYFSKKMLSF